MADREKVLRGLVCCRNFDPTDGCPEECPYSIGSNPYRCCTYTPLLDDAIALLREQEPVAHAAWLIGETITAYDECGVKTWAVKHKCSKCGFVNIAIEAHMGQYSYCPSCGARMDEEIRKVKQE